jgi:hypothetical protein
MSSLTSLEKMTIEKLFGMSTGYVLDFSNRTFQEFIYEVVGGYIYDDRYSIAGESKANRLRTFWNIEDDLTNSVLLKAMLDRYETMLMINGMEISRNDQKLLESCRSIAARLGASSDTPDLGAIRAIGPQREFDLLAKSVRESIQKGEPEVALDRLHTYMMKYLRDRCTKNSIETKQNQPLNALLGSYLKSLIAKGNVLTEMSLHILKSSIGTLSAYNEIRNKRSLAHDNKVLDKTESMFIVKSICNLIQLIEEIDP